MANMSVGNDSTNLSSPSTTIEGNCDLFLDSSHIKIIKTVAYLLLVTFALVGNSLVIIVIWKNRNLRTIVNFLILNMSASDLAIPLIDMPVQIRNIHTERDLWFAGGVLGSATCKFSEFAIVVSVAVSVFTLEIIAVERFFSVVFPMKRQPINGKKSCFIVIAVTWLLGATYSSIFFYKKQITYKGKTVYCIESWTPAFDNQEAAQIEFPFFLVCFSLIPFLLLTSLYSAIIVSLYPEKALHHLGAEARRMRAQENRKVTYMLGTVVVVFLVAWTPFNVYRLLMVYVWSAERPCDSRHLIFAGYFLSCTYPAINPLIYFNFNKNYIRGLRAVLPSFFRCMPCRTNRVEPAARDFSNPNVVSLETTKSTVVQLPLR